MPPKLMALHWPTFFQRLGSAIVFSAIMMGGLLWNAWALLLLVSLICVLCQREFFRIMDKILATQTPGWLLAATWAASLILLWFPPLAAFATGLPPQIAQSKYLPPLFLLPVLLLLLAGLGKRSGMVAGLVVLAAIVYTCLPGLMLYTLRLQSLLLPLALVLLIWMNDTMAYLVGSFIGRTPFSAISPKKTWEGTLGGALLTMGLALWWGWYSGLFQMTDWGVLALCASVAGTAGDLFESKLKRLAGIKDSGKMMPGHGGALDRFDSLLVATPFAFAYAWLFMPTLFIKVF
ncbi:MAG: phosphatidate cytidylyltransferase [Bacteroidetes bacterium]|nr:phosphatidate cytidylyltransferase [Bacteroidota bacterium]